MSDKAAQTTTTTAPGWRVPLSDVLVDDELLEAARDAVSSGWWSMGPRVSEFETRFAEFSGAPHALAVANGTAALHLALLAVGCGEGDEVVLPSLNFVAAANAVVNVGASPVFCDVTGAHDLNLDAADLEAAVSERTKALVLLHYGGWACDVDAALEIARRHSLAVVEDAAHAPGSRLRGRQLGTFGDVGCFSFFANKNLPVGEGGMLVASSDEVAERLRLLRSHGMTTLTWQRHQGHASSYDVVTPGFNYRLDEIRAALATVQLERLEDANASRRRHLARYRDLIRPDTGITIPFADAIPEDASHHLCVAVLPAGVDRDLVRTRMQEARIQTSVHYPPIHRFTSYSDRPLDRALPRTDDVALRILTLPLYPHLADDQIDLVAAELLAAVERAG